MKKRFLMVFLFTFTFILSACAPAPSNPVTKTLPMPQPTLQASPLPALPDQTGSPTTTPVQPAPAVSEFPDPAGYSWKLIANEFRRPVNLTNAGDGSGRLFILEQAGMIRVVSDGQTQPTSFLDIRDRVGSNGNEQGLLGIAFHPDFKQNGIFFLDYTDLNGDTVISRFTADPGVMPTNQLSDPASESILLQIQQPFPNHNGGHIVFGPDGMLWIGMGDGGSGGDPNNNGQSVQTLLGKLLRIDINQGTPYAIPTDNPFVSGGGLPEIWAYGLRNPWVFTFDTVSNDLYIADVGQNQWEEIDYIAAGFNNAPANFGWRLFEGSHPYDQSGASLPENLIHPVFEYSHDEGCSVTGGYVYRGQSLPAFNGIYLFGDYCSGTIWGLIHQNSGEWQSQILFQTNYEMSAFGVDEQGEIYLLDLGGALFRLENN